MRLQGFFLFILGSLGWLEGAAAADVVFLVQNSQPKYLTNHPTEKGLCGDLYLQLQVRLKRKGISSEIHDHSSPVKRIFLLVKTEPGHVFCGATKTAKREKKFRYSSLPLYQVSNVLVARADDHYDPKSYEELAAQGDAVGALYGTTSTNVLRQKIGSLVNDSFTDLESPLKLIGAPPYRLRYFFYHDLGLNYSVKESPYSLRVIGTKFRTFRQWLIYNPDTPENIAEAIELALKDMKDSGELDEIVSRYIY